jgi:hypothetical protein
MQVDTLCCRTVSKSDGNKTVTLFCKQVLLCPWHLKQGIGRSEHDMRRPSRISGVLNRIWGVLNTMRRLNRIRGVVNRI